MAIYAQFSAEGFVRGFFHCAPEEQPAGTILITPEQWEDLYQNQSLRRWDGSRIVVYAPPIAPALPSRTAKADIWRRASDAEAAQIAAGLDALPLRKRRIYDDATYLDHSDPLFAELLAGFIGAFGQARASELLAASA